MTQNKSDTVRPMDNTSICLDLHSIIRIAATDLIKEIIPEFLNNFGIFSSKSDCEDQADILVSRLDSGLPDDLQREPGKLKDTGRFGKNIASLWISKYKDDVSLVIGYRGKADVVISLSNPLHIFYTPRRKCFENLFYCIILSIHVALYRKRGLLFHGAVTCSDDACILLTGPSGAGKSNIVLNMLREGWNYLSDDLFILYKNEAFMFRPYIPIRGYHYDVFPWLPKPGSLIDKEVVHLAVIKEWVRKFTKTHLPDSIAKIISRLGKVYHPSFTMNPHDLFPGSRIIHTAEPELCIVLVPGFEFDFKRVEKTDILQDIAIIQTLDFPEFEKVGRLLSLYGYGTRFNTLELLESQLKRQAFYRMTIPCDADEQWMYSKFKLCLEKVL